MLTSTESLVIQSFKYKEKFNLAFISEIIFTETHSKICKTLIKNIKSVKTRIVEIVKNLFLKIFFIEYFVILKNII